MLAEDFCPNCVVQTCVQTFVQTFVKTFVKTFVQTFVWKQPHPKETAPKYFGAGKVVRESFSQYSHKQTLGIMRLGRINAAEVTEQKKYLTSMLGGTHFAPLQP